MAGLQQNIQQMLMRLTENSRTELDIVRALADGIRRVDEQMLREVRSAAMQHELRREAIFGELQELASRLCAMPARDVMTAINRRDYAYTPAAIERTASNVGGDWPQGAQKIEEELSSLLIGNPARARH